MTLFQRIRESAHIMTAHEADDFLQNANPVVNDLAEIRVCKAIDNQWLYFQNDGNSLPCVSASWDYRKILGYVSDINSQEIESPALRFLLRTAFECRFCYQGIVSLHAACVEVGDFAVAFTGKSGMGKSTRARAWVDALGAEFISGDRPAVRIEKNGGTACGVPWDGKEQIFRDVEKPLKCILEVRRSPANYIRKLSREQARKLIIQQSFMPMWDTDAAFMAMANVSALIDRVPVYRVFCGPDGEDARAIHDILVNHPELIKEESSDLKIKDGFILHRTTGADEFIVTPADNSTTNYKDAVGLNDVSAFIFRQLENPVSRDDLLSAILNEYDVEPDQAAADLDALLDNFRQMGLLEL